MKLHEVKMPTDRWTARAVSPIDISKGVDLDAYGEVVVVHPGWAKAPERHIKLLLKLADQGYLPIGVDTRYAYSNRKTPRTNFLRQSTTVGQNNPYFVSSLCENRWRLRRPTVLLDICERLGIGQRSYIGHSDGGRIAVLAAVARPDQVDKLIVVNGAGTGDSSRGGKRLTFANIARINELIQNPATLPEATISALGSTAYALTHLRRTLAEKNVIQQTDTWAELDQLEDKGVAVTVMHARDDELISFEDSRGNAVMREWINFVPTHGGHSNIYQPDIQEAIVNCLTTSVQE